LFVNSTKHHQLKKRCLWEGEMSQSRAKERLESLLQLFSEEEEEGTTQTLEIQTVSAIDRIFLISLLLFDFVIFVFYF